MTFRELFHLNKRIQLEKAIELDIRVKLAGDKDGYKGLQSAMKLFDEHDEIEEIVTNEATIGNKNILDRITNQVNKGT